MKAIVLTRGRIATVDDEDFEYLNQFKWHARKGPRTYYAVRNAPRANGKQKTVRMHQEVLGASKRIDHENGDGTDNRKENLRRATRTQNAANQKKQRGTSSRFKGVSWMKSHGRWAAYIKQHQNQFFLGLHDTEEAAARAYDKAALEKFGPFAKLNFPA